MRSTLISNGRPAPEWPTERSPGYSKQWHCWPNTRVAARWSLGWSTKAWGTGAVVGNYKVIYRIHELEIRVTDVFDARQDPRKMKG